MSWGQEWGDEKKKVRPGQAPDPDADARKREWEREQARNERYWARPRDVGEAKYAARGPSLPRGQMTIDRAGTSDRLAVVVEIALPSACPRCGMPIERPDELRAVRSGMEMYLVHGSCGARLRIREIRGARMRLATPAESPDQVVRGAAP